MCQDGTIELDKTLPDTHPVLLIAVFIERPTPFLNEFFENIYEQRYPKAKLHLFVRNNVEYHQNTVDSFVKKVGKEYRSVKEIRASDHVTEVDARNLAMYVPDILPPTR